MCTGRLGIPSSGRTWPATNIPKRITVDTALGLCTEIYTHETPMPKIFDTQVFLPVCYYDKQKQKMGDKLMRFLTVKMRVE